MTSSSNNTYRRPAPASSALQAHTSAGRQSSIANVHTPMPHTGYGSIIATPRYSNLISFTSPSGGIGLSTITALVALTLSMQDIDCALLDADIPHGGLGILLGIEHEPGLSLQDIDAPLGRIDGKAFNLELPHWEGINVLACASWRGQLPEWWQMQAAIQALCEANRMVLADVGDGTVGNTCRNCSWHSMLSPWSCRCLAWPVPRHTLHGSNDCARSFRETTSTTPHRLWCLPNHVGHQNDRHHQPSPPRRP